MRWNLRLAAANRGIWKASELQRQLARAGMVVSAGKMSGLWSGQPSSVKLDELDVILAVLGCRIDEILIPEPENIALDPTDNAGSRAVGDDTGPDDGAESSPASPAGGGGRSPSKRGPVVPQRRDQRSLPPL